jgi:hypothetical protein
MQRWGKTAAGKARWYCSFCKSSATRKRPDRTLAWSRLRFSNWVLSKRTYSEQAALRQVHRTTLSHQFAPFLLENPVSVWKGSKQIVLAIDAIRIVKGELVCLIAVDTESGKPVDWLLAPRENFSAWYAFFQQLKVLGILPLGTVSDAQKGLLKALQLVFPGIPHQRCLIHIHRQACIWLTQHPKTEAGQALLALVHTLLQVECKQESLVWQEQFKVWLETYRDFLNERTVSETGRWWYTHRKLRGTRSLLKNALPEMFLFLEETKIPRTSNHVEGGINARLRELLHSHRGLTAAQRGSFACWFLSLKQGQKPTRNAT